MSTEQMNNGPRRSIFEGTMDVISGSLARSVTPRNGDDDNASSVTTGSDSMVRNKPPAPTPPSPEGSRFTNFMRRIPSQDALDRSNHNDSTHGKSPAQIIKDLKASNAALSKKTADMEADFMNQLNKATVEYEQKQAALEESLQRKDQQIKSMESRSTSSESRIREKDSQISKLKEETSFQRHSIADLKNQLYQLQTDIEDAEYDKHDGNSKWITEKQEMKRDMERLEQKVKELQAEAAAANSNSSSPRRKSSTLVNQDGELQSAEVMKTWKQLEQTKDQLEDANARLHETQSAMATLEQEYKKAIKDHDEKMLGLKMKHNNAKADWVRREKDLKQHLHDLESDDIQLTKDLRTQVQDRDKTITTLREDVTKYANQAAELTVEVAKVKAEGESREKYRLDEIEDLRVLNDAQEGEISGLKQKNKELTDEIETLRESRHDENIGRISQLETELQESRDAYDTLESETKSKTSAAEKVIKKLKVEIEHLKADLEDEKQMSKKALEKRSIRQKEDESRSAKRLREVVTNAAKEQAELESQFNAQMEAKTKEVAELTRRLQDMDYTGDETLEIELLESKNEIRTLREKLKVLESKGTGASMARKQLREAQIALVALDDEKSSESLKYREQLIAMEKGMDEMERDFQSKLSMKDSEIADLRDFASSGGTLHEVDTLGELSKLRFELREKEIALEETKAMLAEARSAPPPPPPTPPPKNKNKKTKNESNALKEELEAVKRAKEELEKDLKEKLQDRDTTISTLVKSSMAQEQKVKTLQLQMQTRAPSASPSNRGLGLGEDDETTVDELMSPVKKQKSPSAAAAAAGIGGSTRDDAAEISRLHATIENHKRREETLNLQINHLKRELSDVQEEQDEGKIISAGGNRRTSGAQVLALKRERRRVEREYLDKVKERDDAIAKLVKQSMVQEDEIRFLKDKIKLSTDGSGPGWEEINRLQKESEIFAGQIIEQDEEMEALRGDLDDRETEILSLNKELDVLKRNGNTHANDKIQELQAELDELHEANETQRDELRTLRRQLRESRSASDEVDDLKLELQRVTRAFDEHKQKVGTFAREDEHLRRDLDEMTHSKNELEQKMAQQIESMRRLKNDAVARLEDQLKERDNELAMMEESKSKTSEQITSLQFEVRQLQEEVTDKTQQAEDAQVSLKELRKLLDENSAPEEVFQEKDKLGEEVHKLKDELHMLEADKTRIAELKQRLAKAEEDREMWQHGVVDSYERKLSLLELNKNVTIDKLQKELTEIKAAEADERDELIEAIHFLEVQNKDIKEDLEAKLQLKNSKIFALEQTLGAQEQLVSNMRAEMDQLQNTMELSNITRRAEIEEMQQEVMDSSSRVAKHEREVAALKMKLDESEYLRRSEVQKLQEKVDRLEAQNSSSTNSPQRVEIDDEKLNQVKDRLEKLQWRNTSLQEENVKLRDRLQLAEIDSRAARSDKQKSAVLEQEVTTLMNKVRELEMEARTASRTTAMAQSQRPPTPKLGLQKESKSGARHSSSSPRRVSSSPLRSFLKKRSSSKDEGDDGKSQRIPPSSNGKDDVSTYTKYTF